MTLVGIAWGAGLALVAAIGIGLIRVSRRERADMKLVEWSDRMTAPRDGARIAVCGVIEAEGETFESPVRRRPAVLYHYTVLHSESSRGTTKDVVDAAGYGATPLRIAGSPLTVRLGGFPVLNGFEEKYITSSAARENAGEYLRIASFEEMRKGEIEWVPQMDDMWDGVSRVVRDFKRGSGRPIEQCRFHEGSVSPGDRVCAIGVWSARQNALVPAKGQELWLHRGTRETVHEALSSSVGCGRVLGILLVAASIAAALYLAGVF